MAMRELIYIGPIVISWSQVEWRLTKSKLRRFAQWKEQISFSPIVAKKAGMAESAG